MVNLGNDWDGLLKEEFEQDYYQKLRAFLAHEYKTRTIYPDMHNIFNAFKHTSFGDVKVVLLGQDPYHGEGQAQGLCFSVPDGIPAPPSLQNIFKEIKSDVGKETLSTDLTRWADQGVLLLNTALTVRSGQANSHRNVGWERFTDAVIKKLSGKETPVVFLLWGNNAKAKAALINNEGHLILTAAHPSPLSAYNGFFGCRHFSKSNDFLKKNGLSEIDW